MEEAEAYRWRKRVRERLTRVRMDRRMPVKKGFLLRLHPSETKTKMTVETNSRQMENITKLENDG